MAAMARYPGQVSRLGILASLHFMDSTVSLWNGGFELQERDTIYHHLDLGHTTQCNIQIAPLFALVLICFCTGPYGHYYTSSSTTAAWAFYLPTIVAEFELRKGNLANMSCGYYYYPQEMVNGGTSSLHPWLLAGRGQIYPTLGSRFYLGTW